MRETFYTLGYALVRAVPLLLIVMLTRRVRRNYAEIKRLEEEQKKKEQTNKKD